MSKEDKQYILSSIGDSGITKTIPKVSTPVESTTILLSNLMECQLEELMMLDKIRNLVGRIDGNYPDSNDYKYDSSEGSIISRAWSCRAIARTTLDDLRILHDRLDEIL